jgi:hypothetical protein
MTQPLAALASPDPSHTKAQLRHTQSELGTFLAKDSMRPVLERFFASSSLAFRRNLKNRGRLRLRSKTTEEALILEN